VNDLNSGFHKANQIDSSEAVNHKLVTMTNWVPDLALSNGPRYRAIADALAEDVRRGRVAPGARLPTHRELAWKLRVTTGTVSRAYAEAERRGLIIGEVGRGTFVRAAANAAPVMLGDILGEVSDPDFIDLTINRPGAGGEAAAMAAALEGLAAEPDLAMLLDYQPHAGRPEDRAAGAALLARGGVAATLDQVVITASGQHAMACVIGAMVQPGDTLAVEALTYPGLRALASLLHLRLVPIAMDEQGLVPEALAAACRAAPVRALYTMPTLHNPTTATMPAARREALAELAQRHRVALIEDDVYGFLLDAPLPALAQYAPEQGFYITSTSKSLMPALRVGYVHAPKAQVERLVAAVRATTYSAPPLMTRIAARWIADGTAERLAAAKRAEMRRRNRMAREVLAGAELAGDVAASHLWLTLPEPWRADDFAAAARRRGVGIIPAAAFAVGRHAPNAVRICLGAQTTFERVERALARLAELLATSPERYLSVV
jgi:DNA-binding transcriptional MocR family regulator